ncbi:MAG: hypothetical protein WCK51_05795 [Armatimonadota bacterium]
MNYRIEISNPLSGTGKAIGTLHFWEKKGSLGWLVTIPNEDPKCFIFDGKKSFVYASKSSIWLVEGFSFYQAYIPLVFPFNFASYRLFIDVPEGAKYLPPGVPASQLEEFPFVLHSRIGSTDIVDGVSLTERSAAGVQSLEIGAKDAPLVKATYSKFQQLGTLAIPREVTISSMKQIFDHKTKTTRSESRGEFKLILLDCSLNLGPKAALAPEQFLGKGSLIQCSDSQARWSVAFDPTSGSLDKQSAALKQSRMLFEADKKREGGSAKSSRLTIPVILTVIFGGLSIFFLIKGRKEIE